jgi:hypothetical protein
MSTYNKVEFEDGMTGDQPVDEAMEAAKAEANPEVLDGDLSIPSEEPNYGDLLAEKFGGDVEKLAQAYSELERKMSSATAAEPAEPTEPTETSMEAVQPYIDEFHSTGELSDASREALEKMFPAALVDDYLAKSAMAQEYSAAQEEQQLKGIYETVGGEAQYAQMVNWASNALSPEAIEAFNESVNGTAHQAELAVRGLAAQYAASGAPKTPNLLQSKPEGITGLAPYESLSQVTKDMATKEYKEDPAFRAKVHARMGVSNVI